MSDYILLEQADTSCDFQKMKEIIDTDPDRLTLHLFRATDVFTMNIWNPEKINYDKFPWALELKGKFESFWENFYGKHLPNDWETKGTQLQQQWIHKAYKDCRPKTQFVYFLPK